MGSSPHPTPSHLIATASDYRPAANLLPPQQPITIPLLNNPRRSFVARGVTTLAQCWAHHEHGVAHEGGRIRGECLMMAWVLSCSYKTTCEIHEMTGVG